VGSVNNYFHIPGVAEHALFLKELGDARAIRQRIIESLERANSPAVGDEERSRLLHFVVVGGGPTGVEFAAEMHDFLVDDLAKAFPGLVGSIRISLLEAAGHILGSFDTALAAYTIRHFQRQKIEVRMNSPVTRVDATGIYLRNGEVIPYGVLVWSTGVTPSPFLKSLSWPKSAEGRLLVDDHLRVRGIEDVFAIGDCAALEGKELPLTAQVAQQQGFYLARALGNLAVHKDVAPFRFRNLGMLAYIGGNRALADLAAVKWRGFSAWLFWRSAYLTRLVSLKNKVLVVFDWVKGRLFGRDISRF
jgi:NADH:ubiquinone reductase (non-electrogenic)